MSDRHDLRRQTREIREALSRFEPEQLIDILTHVFRQYVMEGAAAPASSLTMQDELQGLSFPQLIERLQLRLDLPELRLLEIAGGRVHVRVEGRLVPLELPETRAPEPLPVVRNTNISQIQLTAQPTTPPPAPPPAAPGTESREVAAAVPPGVAPVGHSGSPRPDGTARAAAPRPAGVSATARPAAPAAAAAPGRPASGPAPAGQPAAGNPAPARPDKPAPPEKPDAGRFNLLEID